MDLVFNNIFVNHQDPYPYLDSLIAVTFISGWILMIKKYIQAYIIYFICTIATIILCMFFIINDNYYFYLIYLVTNLFYLGFYIIGSSNWIQIYVEND